MRRLLLLPPAAMAAAAIAAVQITGVFAAAEENPLSQFYEIAPDNRCADGRGAGPRAAGTLFRGAVPDEAGLLYLRAHGIKTILNFQTQPDVSAERKLIERLGLASLNEIPHPMVGRIGVNRLPNGDYDNDSIIAAVADMRRSEYFPEYVHCTRGQDRTGMTVALHRVFNECWPAADAEEEWDRIEGWLRSLSQFQKHHYFRKVMQDAALHKYCEDQLEKLAPQR